VNPMDMFKNLQDLQSKMGEAQEKLKTLRADGSSGGELVKVTVDGTMEALSVHIDPIAVDPRDVKMLEELVAAAYTDAVRKMRDTIQREMSQLAGGFPLPPGFPGGGDA
jgi:DNA-binding YbaB/EbfC family protein